LEVLWFEEIDSTHKYLIEEIKKGNITKPTLVGADFQSDGVGSRGNSWEGKKGNLFCSFCVKEKQLPKDLQLASTSIYFSYLLKEVLVSYGSKVWIKWPNDFYLQKRKIGGAITTKTKEHIVGSFGLNIAEAPLEFGVLDVHVEPKKIVKDFLETLEKKISWKKVFSKYKVEFQNSRDFFFHVGSEKKSLRNAKLCEDGSIELDKRRVYSLR
jgi:BirA family biotin operon repressor/biotin-[acetyl-CoA-carboxylase] ligase